LLHPPLLEELGLAQSTRNYLKGFEDRSGIRVSVDIPAGFKHLPPRIEIALFRILQEAVTNVHRHARAAKVNVQLWEDSARISLVVRDHGCGMSPQRLLQVQIAAAGGGVGVASMRERLRELGGTLEIQSGEGGTTVTATVPLPISGGQ
jgi:signal transduction histidine kinase